MERQTREPKRKDPYHATDKPKGHPQCEECKAISLKGRWVTEDAAKSKGVTADGSAVCPACRQTRDHYALGVVEIRGRDWKENEDRIRSTVLRTEEIARSRNDQQRVISIEAARDGLAKIYVTLPELARHLGRELVRSFKGTLKTMRESEEPFVRIVWDSTKPEESEKPLRAKGVKPVKNVTKASRHRGISR